MKEKTIKMHTFKNLYLDIKFYIEKRKARSYLKEDRRYTSGIYCDKKGCIRKRVAHIHGTKTGVTYYCDFHKTWAI